MPPNPPRALGDKVTNWNIAENKTKLTLAVASASSISGVLNILGLKPAGGNYKTIQFYINEWNLDISHHLGKGWKKTYLHDKDSYKSKPHLRKRLIAEFGYRCSLCGISEWMNKPLTLEMDHINGENYDNRFENVRLLCPNCHSQTDTFRSKNRKGA